MREFTAIQIGDYLLKCCYVHYEARTHNAHFQDESTSCLEMLSSETHSSQVCLSTLEGRLSKTSRANGKETVIRGTVSFIGITKIQRNGEGPGFDGRGSRD